MHTTLTGKQVNKAGHRLGYFTCFWS